MKSIYEDVKNDSISLRYYQADSVEKGIIDIKNGKNPVIAIPPGGGKSIVLCGLSEEIINFKPTANILILSHVQEILEQNHKALSKYFDGIQIGLFSAGLEAYEIRKITVASIQTVMNKPNLFKHFDFVLIDEAHRVSFDSKTGYRKFIDKIKPCQCIGLTATPYRMKGGYIYEGEDALFDKLSVDYTSLEKFTGLIEEGYLSEVMSKKTSLKMNIEGVRTTAGDFNSKELSEKLDRDNITGAAIIETIYWGKSFKHWICFAIDIDHANHICERLNAHGIKSCVVHSQMEMAREQIAAFKRGEFRCLVNVEMLTIGFDFINIDLIIHLRPTQSPILHVQSIGRGLRPVYAEGYDLNTKEGRLAAIANGSKPFCLMLDFAGNTKRLGCINDPYIKEKSDKKGKGKAITKDCPACDFINHGAARVCNNCGHEFKIQEKLSMEASHLEIIKKLNKEPEKAPYIPAMWVKVDKIKYSEAHSSKAGRFVRVEYLSGISTYQEVVCIEAKGYAKLKAINWIKQRWMDTTKRQPQNTTELMQNLTKLLVPKQIFIDINGKYAEIKNSKFH